MNKYDVIVIGSGCGAIISDEAASHGLNVALVDNGPLIGGTCLNWGCIPSKMLIYVADRVVEIQEAKRLGIKAQIKEIDFASILERMRKSRQLSQTHIRKGISKTHNLDFYEGVGHFISDDVIEVNGEKIAGEKFVIASGSRVLIPPVRGLETVAYLTNETVLELEERPESIIIIGGGYIAVEYGHFFAAMGTNVTILEMAERLVLSEEPETSELLKKSLGKRMRVHTNLMVAVGRRSNADLLKLENTGIETDKRGFIKVDEYLETSRKNMFSVGDANGQHMFTHVANREAAVVAENILHDGKLKMDYSSIPHAVYSHPQIASVGLGEEQAKKDYNIVVGTTKYFDIAKGEAMMEKEGFAKAIVEKSTDKILGFHIIGPYAPELIQEVVNAMTSGGQIAEINQGIHIHPALSELIPTILNSLEES